MTPKELDDFLHNPTEGYFVKFSGLKTWWDKRTHQEQGAIQSNWYSIFKPYEVFWLWNAAEALQRSGETPVNVQEAHRDVLLSWIRDRISAPRHPLLDKPEPTDDEKRERRLTWEDTYKILKKNTTHIKEQKEKALLARENKTREEAVETLKTISDDGIQKLKEDYDRLKDEDDIAF